MKTTLAGIALILFTIGLAAAQTNTPSGLTPVAAKRAAALPVVTRETAPISNSASNNVNAGVIVRGEPVQVIRPVPGGARADYGLQKVFFPLDARGTDALTITTPDGRILKCRATFLAAHDRVTDQRWLIAEVTNRIGEIVGPDQVIYTNCFDSLNASLRFRYSKYSLEQDVLLHENPILPKEFSPENVRLEVWSEWFDSQPTALVAQALDLRSGDTPSLIEDLTVDFGAAKIGAGHAFSSDAVNERTPIGKRWERSAGCDWLIEVVDYRAIQSRLEQLPAQEKPRTSSRRSSQREQLIRSLATLAPSAGERAGVRGRSETMLAHHSKTNPRPMLLAQPARSQQPEFVLDFVIVSSVPVPSGVISWWPGGGNAADAISASNNDGSWVGATNYGAGKVGPGFTLAGGSNLEIPNAPGLNPTNAVTVETWINPSSDIVEGADLVSKDGEWSERQYFLTYVAAGSGGIIRAHVGVPSGLYYLDGEITVAPESWTHVAMTYDAATGVLSIYVNGQLDTQGQTSGAIVATTQPVRIGGGEPYNYAPYYFSGAIDEPALYNRALGQSEIQAIYSAGVAGKLNPNCSSAPTNIVAWWSGDDHGYDLARLNHATLNGATYAAAVVSQGFNLDGVNDHGTAPNDNALNLGVNESLSIEVWLNPLVNDNDYGSMSILGKRYCPDFDHTTGYELFLVNGAPWFQLGNGTSYANFAGSGDLRNGSHHLAVTVDRSSTNGGQMYVDGILIMTFDPTVITGSLSNSQPVRVGMNALSGFNGFYKGLIDEVTVYRRALTGTEVTALYSAGSAGKCKTDTDSDGLTDLQEDFLGTDPDDSDTDNDGLTDGDEVFIHHTNPNAADTDGDGVSDGVEILQGRNPNAGATSDSLNQIKLQIFTPLK